MDQFADDLAAWLDVLAIREAVVVCGLSMGGYIAFQFWRKFAARLRGLILCDTRAIADTPEAAAGRRSMAERVLREGPAPLVETMLPKLLAETTLRQRPELVERLRGMIGAGNPQGAAAAARGMAERPDMTASLARIRCPTLVVAGQHDAISPPAEMRNLAAAIPARSSWRFPPPVTWRRWRTRWPSVGRCGSFWPESSSAARNVATYVGVVVVLPPQRV